MFSASSGMKIAYAESVLQLQYRDSLNQTIVLRRTFLFSMNAPIIVLQPSDAILSTKINFFKKQYAAYYAKRKVHIHNKSIQMRNPLRWRK